MFDNDQKNNRLQSLNFKISALQKLLVSPKVKSIFLLKIDGRYIKTVDMTCYVLNADEEKDCISLSDVADINEAMHFDKNAVHRTKYFVDFHHDCKFEIVNFHSELLDLIEKKKYLRFVVHKE